MIKLRQHTIPPVLILLLIWLLSNMGDRLWIGLDRSVPAWDQANHLSYSLRYLDALKSPDFGNGDWWRRFWALSPKYPPITYLLSVPFQWVLGTGNGQALFSNLISSGILITAVYLLGKRLLDQTLALWAVAIMVLIPRIIHTRLQFLLDTPLLAFTLLSFTCLTLWKEAKTLRGQWLWASAFGVSLGLGLLTKQSILFYLFFPLLGIGGWILWRRQWQRLGQLIVSFLITVPLWYPWYRTNWIYLFSTAQNSNAIPASMEGDPAVNTLAAWTYYGKDLPLALSWVWLLPPIVGLLLAALGRFPQKLLQPSWREARPALLWLGYYVASTYLVCSALYNKDSRYILPYLPVLAILLAYGLTRWCGRWQWVRWATLAVAILVTMGNLFPIPHSDRLTRWFSPDVLYRPAAVQPAPLEELVAEALAVTPQQQITLGVIPNTNAINPNTVNYFGARHNFQVYGRELSGDEQKIEQDYQNFDWLVTKSADNGNAQPAQLAIADRVATDPNFVPQRQWTLPDESQLILYRRRQPRVEVTPTSKGEKLPTLLQVEVADNAPPGQSIPVTYQWQGDRQTLNQGLVLLTWRSVDDPNQYWLQDHAIGLGELWPAANTNDPSSGLTVTEHTAMLPPATLPPGDYQLEAQWLDVAQPWHQPSTPLDSQNWQATPLTIPPVTIRLDPNTPPVPAPPVDYGSQLLTLAQNLQRGPDGLEPVFAQVDRLNLYDSPHSYLQQLDLSLSYRLAQTPNNPVPLAYGQVLARVLQENPQSAIAALQSLVALDPENPFNHAYLAFVYLYDWQGKQGETALQPALVLAPDNEEIQGLQAIAFFMQGKLLPAWQTAQPLL